MEYYNKVTVSQLQKLCKHYDIKGYTRKRKAELFDALDRTIGIDRAFREAIDIQNEERANRKILKLQSEDKRKDDERDERASKNIDREFERIERENDVRSKPRKIPQRVKDRASGKKPQLKKIDELERRELESLRRMYKAEKKKKDDDERDQIQIEREEDERDERREEEENRLRDYQDKLDKMDRRLNNAQMGRDENYRREDDEVRQITKRLETTELSDNEEDRRD